MSEAVEGLVLLKHGIFTFGSNAEEAYERMISAVSLAEERLAQRVVARARLARLGARKRQLACVCAERDECEAGGDCSQPNTPNRFAVGWRPNGVS